MYKLIRIRPGVRFDAPGQIVLEYASIDDAGVVIENATSVKKIVSRTEASLHRLFETISAAALELVGS